MSYAHIDHELARRLQRGVETYGRGWLKTRRSRIFRDATSLGAEPSLREGLEKSMASSRWLILLASPEAANSNWVKQETDWWLDNRDTEHIVIVLTGGTLEWNRQQNQVDTSTDALPARLTAALDAEPVWVDLRWARGSGPVDRRDPRLPDAFASIAAPIRQVPKDTLIGEHLREGRRRRTAAVVIIALIMVLTLIAVVLRIGLGQSQSQAGARALGQLAALRLPTDPTGGTQLALAAYRADPSDDLARSALAQAYMERRSTVASRLTPGASDRSGGEAGSDDTTPAPDAALTTDPDVDVSAFAGAEGVVVADGLEGDHPQIEPVPGTQRGDRPLAVTGNGQWIVVSDLSGAKIWDRRSGEDPKRLESSRPGVSVKSTPDGSRLVVASPRPGGAEVSIVSVQTGESSPPVIVPAIGPVWQTADPAYLIARTSPPDLQGNHFSVFDARTGALVRSVDPNGSVVLDGVATITSGVSTGAGDGSVDASGIGNNALILNSASTGALMGTIATSQTGSIDGPIVTSDTHHVVLPDGSAEHGITAVREVDLITGRTDGAWLPSVSGIEEDASGTPRSTQSLAGATTETTRLAVHGERGLLLDRGSVDTISFERPPENAYAVTHGVPIGFADGPSAVVVYDNGVTTFRTSDGTIISKLVFTPGERFQAAAGRDLPALGDALTANRFTGVVTRSDGNPEVRDYAVPSLTKLGTYDLVGAGAIGTPGVGPQGTTIQVGVVGEETVILSGGVLSWWSAATHRLIAPPVTVTTDPATITQLAQQLNDGLTTGGLPDGPNEAVVLRDPTGVSVYRPGAAHPTHIEISLPANSVDLTQELTHGRLVTVEKPGLLVQRDPDSGRLLAPGVPVPLSTILLGADETGNPVTVDNGVSGDPVVSSWNLETNARTGTFTLPGTVTGIFAILPVRQNMWPISSGTTFLNLPIDPGQWQRGLCRAQDRDFTPDERAVLPTAIDDTAPCPDL